MQNKKPAEAKALVDSNQGWTYLDVRSVDEFSGGHPVGAWNIPVLHRGPMGMTPNADFVAVVAKTFPKTAKLVVGCASGVRSVRACEMLEAAGYTELVNMEGGFMGSRDDFGRAIPGWASSGLPVAAAAPIERTYAKLSQAKT
ncbi:MAG: rhodanese-like domain-containing protein [Planctomycetota bacterium]|nr:rhodanese-like domain-containing protein [Planctomycetota bacterium]